MLPGRGVLGRPKGQRSTRAGRLDPDTSNREEVDPVTDPQPLGRLIDSLGVEHRPVEADGRISMRSAWSPGLSWMERVGMHQAAAQADLPARPADRWDTRDLDGVSVDGLDDGWDETEGR